MGFVHNVYKTHAVGPCGNLSIGQDPKIQRTQKDTPRHGQDPLRNTTVPDGCWGGNFVGGVCHVFSKTKM